MQPDNWIIDFLIIVFVLSQQCRHFLNQVDVSHYIKCHDYSVSQIKFKDIKSRWGIHALMQLRYVLTYSLIRRVLGNIRTYWRLQNILKAAMWKQNNQDVYKLRKADEAVTDPKRSPLRPFQINGFDITSSVAFSYWMKQTTHCH